MKTKILRLGITVLIAIGVISCGSKSEKKTESVMSVKEAIIFLKDPANKNYALVLASLDKAAQVQGRQKMPIFDCHRLA